jgi:hypothetical protein
MKTFLNDGFDKSDFEKLITGLAYIVLVIAIVYMFIKYRYSDYNIIGLCVGAGGLFVARKIGSYMKNENYYKYNQSQQYNSQPLSPIQPTQQEQHEQEFIVEPNQQVQPEQTISPKSSY